MKDELKTREQVIHELRRIFAGEKKQKPDVNRRIKRFANPKKVDVMCITKNLADSKQVVEGLRESDERFRIIAELSPFPISIIDSNGRYLYLNQKFIEVFGYTMDDIPSGREWFSLAYPNPEYRRQALSAWFSDVEKFRNYMVRPREFRVTCKDGKIRNILFRTVSMENGQQFITYEDLTERKLAQEQIQQILGKLRKALGGAIQAIALTVEKRDAYTAGHQRRVANLARTIAKEMGLSNYRIDGIRMAGVIHDLGKIAVPGEILSKPGQLNDNEFSLIKAHPQVGYGILKEIDFPWPVAQIVLQHHERMDGSGYPHRLSGEDIILEARIMAVADVVEAMASHRPYRPALGIKEALKEISQNSGTQYDAKIVDVCRKLFTEKGFILE
ncbi:MAG: HD domain-containing protein [Deltaproteobacteria bacterium]|nr:HD domain-containing protein [Deltaproteobacteria bacterium]